MKIAKELARSAWDNEKYGKFLYFLTSTKWEKRKDAGKS